MANIRVCVTVIFNNSSDIRRYLLSLYLPHYYCETKEVTLSATSSNYQIEMFTEPNMYL